MAQAKKTVRKSAKAESANAFESANFAATNDQIRSFMEAFSTNAETVREQTEDFLASARENFETVQTRFQAVGHDFVSAAREEAADAVTFVNDLARAKTVGDALEIQRDYWTNLFETRVERARELTKASVEAARESFQPAAKSLAVLPGFAALEKFFPFGVK
jgi:hypothetical protein